MAAVLMLVFKDPILGLVAGIQLSANDMLKLGDWLEEEGGVGFFCVSGGLGDVKKRRPQRVAGFELVVGEKLNPRHKSEYRVFKHQHQDGSHGTQTAYKNRRGLADEQRDNQYTHEDGATYSGETA